MYLLRMKLKADTYQRNELNPCNWKILSNQPTKRVWTDTEAKSKHHGAHLLVSLCGSFSFFSIQLFHFTGVKCLQNNKVSTMNTWDLLSIKSKWVMVWTKTLSFFLFSSVFFSSFSFENKWRHSGLSALSSFKLNKTQHNRQRLNGRDSQWKCHHFLV